MADAGKNPENSLIIKVMKGQIQLEEAYCEAKNYLADYLELTDPEKDKLTSYMQTLSFIEEILAEKYMKAAGYYCDSSTGKEIWKKKYG